MGFDRCKGVEYNAAERKCYARHTLTDFDFTVDPEIDADVSCT